MASLFEEGMENAKTNDKNLWDAIKFGAYFGIVSTVLNRFLADGFSIPDHLAFGIAVLAAALGAFPLFVRGTANPWKKDRTKWTLLPWGMFSVIVAVISFLFLRILSP